MTQLYSLAGARSRHLWLVLLLLGATGAPGGARRILTKDPLRLEEVVVTSTPVDTIKKQLGNTIAAVSGSELPTAVPTRIG